MNNYRKDEQLVLISTRQKSLELKRFWGLLID